MQFLYLLIIVLGSVAVLTTVSACPADCVCRRDSVNCLPGLTGWPYGFTSIITSLSLSGLPSKHNTLHHIQRQPNLLALVNLTRLVITYSKVTVIDDKAFAGLNKLTVLSLADNELRSLNENTFRGLPSLITLDLSGNQNCQFTKTVFSPINDIEELNLGDMNITMLPADIFSELNNLKVLKLYSNRLKTITPKIFEPLSLLESLDLSENLLRDLPHTLKPMLNRLRGLHLSDNPWECTCQLYWFHELKKEFLINTLNGGEVICHSPDTIKYTAFVNVLYNEFLCRPPKILHCYNNRYELDVNHTLVVSCEFEGSPVPEIKWIQPGGKEFTSAVKTDGQHFVFENGTLIIKGISIEDDGQWIFLISNGTAYDMAYVTVKVVTPITSTFSTSSALTLSVKTIEKPTLSSKLAPLLTTGSDLPTSPLPKLNLLSALTSAIPTSVTQDLITGTTNLLSVIHLSTKTSSSTSRPASPSAPQTLISAQSTSSALQTSAVPPATRRAAKSTNTPTKTAAFSTKLPVSATHPPLPLQLALPAIPHKRYAGLILLDLISLD